MLSCKEVSKLVSDSLEERLPFPKRVGVRIHLMMCTMCRAYQKQLIFLRQILTGYNQWLAEDGPAGSTLPSDTADRIKRALADQVDDEPKKNL